MYFQARCCRRNHKNILIIKSESLPKKANVHGQQSHFAAHFSSEHSLALDPLPTAHGTIGLFMQPPLWTLGIASRLSSICASPLSLLMQNTTTKTILGSSDGSYST